jgi:hypothetical protein
MKTPEQRIAEATAQLSENAIDLFGDLFPGDPRDLWDDVDGFQPVPPGGVPPYYWNNRGRGEVLPVYTSWLQLKYIRDRSRRLAMENEFAICALQNRRNYVVGDGFTYRVTGDNDDLNTRAQKVLDIWASYVDLAEYESDAMDRLDKDGEFFLRFWPQDNGMIELRFVEPEHVKDRTGDPWSPAISFGVNSAIDDVENIVSYSIMERPWLNETPSEISADAITHVKLNVPRNAKRGLPTFYPVASNLRRANDLLASMASMAKTRAKIALIRKMLNATGQASQNLIAGLQAGTITDPVVGQNITLERLRYGTILTSTGNIEYEMPGSNVDAGGFVEVLQAELRGIAARLNMPEWMLTADASNANLASSLVAEAPSTKEFRRIQRMLCRVFGESRHPTRKAVAWRQLEYAAAKGIIDPKTLTECKIQCEGPSLVVRDKQEEAATNQIYVAMGVKSKQTVQQELGLDGEQESKNMSAGLEAAAAAAPIAGVQQQESRVREDQTPDLDAYIRDKFKDRPQHENIGPETGFLLANGTPVQIGFPGQPRPEHKTAVPSGEEMNAWGWPANLAADTTKLGGSLPGLHELMRRSGAVRLDSNYNGMGYAEHATPLTYRQKSAIKNYLAENPKLGGFMFSRVAYTPDGQPIHKTRILDRADVGDYLDTLRESVTPLREIVDRMARAHDRLGWPTDIMSDSPGAAILQNVADKQNEFATKKEMVKAKLQAASDAAHQAHDQLSAALTGGLDPTSPAAITGVTNFEKLADEFAKQKMAYQQADRELAAVTGGEIRPSVDDFDTMLRSQPFGIISAGRNPNREDHAAMDDSEFQTRHQQLGNQLTALGKKWVPMHGRYGADEDSYLVPMPEDETHILTGLGRKFEQDSVIHSAKGVNHMIYTSGPQTGSEHRGEKFDIKPDADDLFSSYTDPTGKQLKFALNFDFGQLHRVGEAVNTDQPAATDPVADWKANRFKSLAFKNWFGDWENDPANASKVVNVDTKTPTTNHYVKTVYRGGKFDPTTGTLVRSGGTGMGAGTGMYFAENPEIAQQYAASRDGGTIVAAHLNVRNPFDWDANIPETQVRKLVNLAKQNNPEFDPQEFNEHRRLTYAPSRRVPNNAGARIFEALAESYGRENVNPLLKQAGYDGVVHSSRDILGSPSHKADTPADAKKFGRVWVVFDHKNVKSVDNLGTFKPESENILEAKKPVSRTLPEQLQDIRDLMHASVPTGESIDEMPAPEVAAAHYHNLDAYLKQYTGRDLKSVLQQPQGHDKIHSHAGESLVAAMLGGEHLGGDTGQPDTFKKNDNDAGLYTDVKMTTGSRRRVDNDKTEKARMRAAGRGQLPIFVGFNPGGPARPGMLAVQKGGGYLPTEDTAELKQREAAGTIFVHRFKNLEDLGTPEHVAAFQQGFKDYVNKFGPDDVSKQNTVDVGSTLRAMLATLRAKAGAGDENAKNLLNSVQSEFMTR